MKNHRIPGNLFTQNLDFPAYIMKNHRIPGNFRGHIHKNLPDFIVSLPVFMPFYPITGQKLPDFVAKNDKAPDYQSFL